MFYCYEKCSYYLKGIIKELIIKETEKISREEEIEYYDNLIKIIEKVLTSQNYDTSKLDSLKDDV